ncbi:hypothetical protein FF011L_11150 [Roseimaritima multifibrata]|uniref:Uncharacterized protein n=1 Tax=Roseimaritima multifibrata TaxID=1930274 RepID=A0A517MBW9_9BACT|nr:hypothetical protein FF011L_11150 [Roseimaritima multifibrata]
MERSGNMPNPTRCRAMPLIFDDNRNSNPWWRRTVRRCTPRFSLKLLLAVPLLVAVYLAVGKATREYGPNAVASFLDVEQGYGNPGYVAPFVLEFWTMSTDGSTADVRMDYYLWLFGWVIETPISRTQTTAMGPTRKIGDIIRESSISTFVNDFGDQKAEPPDARESPR